MNQMEQQEEKTSFYDYIVAHDIVEHLRPLWEQAGFKIRESDGKFYSDARAAVETPWHYIKEKWDFDCYTWHQIIFEHISKRLIIGKQFVPAKCHECFKVVVRPKTLKQLFALEKLELAMNLPCKCGIEVRNTVHGLYGGYFYNAGLDEGLRRYQQVRKAVNETEYMGPEVPVILKRGCTEFELACGPSDKWEVSPEQIKIEEMINQYLVKDDVLRKQPEHVVRHLHRKWIEFAYAHGDSTYAEFTGGKPLYPPVVTYHHLVEPSAPNMESPIKAED